MQFKQLQKKNFGTSTGFEPMAPALALQCSYQLNYEDPYIGSRPIELNKLAATLYHLFLETRKWFLGRKCNGTALYARTLFLLFSLTVLSSLC